MQFKNFFIFTLKLLFTVALLWYALTLLEFDLLLLTLGKVNVGWLLLAFSLNVTGTVFLKSLLMCRLFDRVDTATFADVVKINFSMRFYSLFLPKVITSSIRVARYKKITGNVSDAFALFTFEGLLSFLLPVASAILFLVLTRNIDFVWQLVSLLVVVMVAILALMICFSSGRASNKIITILDGMSHSAILKTPSLFLKSFFERLAGLNLGDFGKLSYTIILSILSFVIYLLNSVVLLQAINLNMSFFEIAWIRSILFVLTNMPVAVAGVGVREVGFIELFSLYGVSATVAISYSMLVFTMFLGVSIVGGCIELKSKIFKK